MILTVIRDIATPHSTGSRISVNGEEFCFGLEPAWTEDETVKPRAIPPGTYNVTRRFSPKHKAVVPHVENVPGFEDIEIHPGNFPKDTLGCLLVGAERGDDCVLNSKVVFAKLDAMIARGLLGHQTVTINYVNDFKEKV